MSADVTNESVVVSKSTRSEVDNSSTIQFNNREESSSKLKVIRRNGRIVPFDSTKIKIAVTKAFLDVEGQQSGSAITSNRVHEIVENLTEDIVSALNRSLKTGGAVHIENIQDQVELALMRAGYLEVARSYIIYREEHRKLREQRDAIKPSDSDMMVTLDNGKKVILDKGFLHKLVDEALAGLTDVEPGNIVSETLKGLFDGVSIDDVRKSLILTTRTLIEKEPNYSFVAARLLLNECALEACRILEVPPPQNTQERLDIYPLCFYATIKKGVEFELLDPALLEFDLEKISQAIKPESDNRFTYLGLQTLYDRYFLHKDGKRFELPQVFFMRVAMGLAIEEDNKTARAIEFYELLSSFDFMSSTPTLFNSGTLRPQLSSCFLTTVPDDLAEIYNAIKDNALLSKFAGGLGNDWTQVRAMNAHIQGTNGKSQGVVPFLKVANDTAVAVNQGGKRKGAVCAYLEAWHLDIEEFLELRKNTGDERRRTHDMNTATWIPDLFMKRVEADSTWTLFSPDETPDLHDIYGSDFEKAYVNYETLAQNGKIKNFKSIPALKLWRKMLSMVFETGHPWLTFKDPCNIRSPQQHVGVVHSSNLCTEITLNTSEDEIAVCNLGSINLSQHIDSGGINIDKIKKTVKTAIRMLDNVIDINYYSVIQARRSNLKHRPIGLGIMGFQDALYKLNYANESTDSIELADRTMEAISYYAIEASTQLAQERGVYQTFEGSLWSKGILPIDSIALLQQNRGQEFCQDQSSTLDWDSLRQRVKTIGMRNSNVLAIAPTATISNICGVCQSIEPTYQNLYVKSNLSGEFTIVNPYLVSDLKDRGIWDAVMVSDLKYYNGSVKNIERVPEDIKQKYATAFEIEPKWLIDAASRRQKWIDQSQSLNLYIDKPTGKKLDTIYRYAWHAGLKTTYYLRSLGASDTEKSTINRSVLNAVTSTAITAQACNINDPECESCQ